MREKKKGIGVVFGPESRTGSSIDKSTDVGNRPEIARSRRTRSMCLGNTLGGILI